LPGRTDPFFLGFPKGRGADGRMYLILTDSVVGDFFNNDAALISNPNGFNSL
jgi:hypothetical protein